MKEIFQQYASYHLWANKRLTDCILVLTDEQQQQKFPTSFPSLFATLNHMYNVDVVWWKRVKQDINVIAVNTLFTGTTTELSSSLLAQDALWEAWVHEADAAMFNNEIQYQNTRGDKFSQPVFQLLLQLFNHGTYHRGQLVTNLHQLGITNIPSTDFITWSRGK